MTGDGPGPALPAFVVRRSPIHGTGVFAARDIAAEEELLEYAGRRLTHAQADEIYPDDDGHTFLFVLNDQYVIDGGVGGNEARWINHSCEPNCEVWAIESDDGDPAGDFLVIQSIRPIRAGEELTYDYGILSDEPITGAVAALWACRCGSPRCRGVMVAEDAAAA
jgi:uncharacterized protein